MEETEGSGITAHFFKMYYSEKYYLGLREDHKAFSEIEALSARAFKGTPEKTCSQFGCARILTAEENLYGSKCIHHSNINGNGSRYPS